MKSLFVLLLFNTPLVGGWPDPTTAEGVLQNLDRPARLPLSATAEPAPPVKSELDLVITVRSRLDVTVICRTRGTFFNHDLPRERPGNDQRGADCSQVAGEKGSERIEDGRARRSRNETAGDARSRKKR